LINYNKELQKNLSIKIEDYIKASGKIKIIEKNGKGKEYSLDSNIIRFEGVYYNRKRTRLGKEFDNNGKLEFEGKYWNGKRHGKGKEYHYIYYDFCGSGDKYEEIFLMDKKVMIKKKKIFIYMML
jgi:antitoxin component YwqK of YwqJK toxin-antitoxin module